MKSFIRSAPVQIFLGWLFWVYMATVGRTTRWSVEGEDAARELWADAPGVIVASWHSRVLMLPMGWHRYMIKWPKRPVNVAMMVSLSPDGECIAKAVHHTGLETIRGSSTNKKKKKDKGGVRAIALALKKLKQGGAICLTPDGPRGPMQRAQAGPILLAQRSGAPILTYALAAKPSKRVGSWDRMMVPAPFSKGVVVFGAPVYASKDDDPEALRLQLEESLNAATQRAEELAGVQVITPTPLADG